MTTPARAAAGPTTGFLEESPGNRSSMRLMCLLALLASIAFGSITMLRSAPMVSRDAAGQDSLTYPPRDDTGMIVTFAFLLAAFAPKVVQKFAEQRLGALGSTGLRELVLGVVRPDPATATDSAAAGTLLPLPRRIRAWASCGRSWAACAPSSSAAAPPSR